MCKSFGIVNVFEDSMAQEKRLTVLNKSSIFHAVFTTDLNEVGDRLKEETAVLAFNWLSTSLIINEIYIYVNIYVFIFIL